MIEKAESLIEEAFLAITDLPYDEDEGGALLAEAQQSLKDALVALRDWAEIVQTSWPPHPGA